VFACYCSDVPKEIQNKVRELLVASGPLVQSRFRQEWKKTFPNEEFEFQTYGFERLTDALESMTEIVVITRDTKKVMQTCSKAQTDTQRNTTHPPVSPSH